METEQIVFLVAGSVLAVVAWLAVVSEWDDTEPGEPQPPPDEGAKELGTYIIHNASVCLAGILTGMVLGLLGVVLAVSEAVPYVLGAIVVWTGVATFGLAIIFMFTIGLYNRPKFLVRPSLRNERGWLGRR